MPNRDVDGARILVVEDEALIAEEVRDRLVRAGFVVVGIVDTGPAAVEAASSVRPDLVLMDIRLKGRMDGVEAGEQIYHRFEIPIVYLTAHSDSGTLKRAKTTAAFGYVLKPFHVDNLLAAVELAIRRSRLEAHLQAHQLTYETILASIADAVISTDVDGRVRFINGGAEQLLGVAARDAEGRELGAVLRICDEAGRPAQMHLATRVLAGRASVRFDPTDHVAVARGRTPIDGAAGPVIDGLGRVVGMTVTLRDVSEARSAERALRVLSEQLRAVVDTAVDGVMLIGAGGTVRMFNPACERLFGYAADKILGRSAAALLPSLFSARDGHPFGDAGDPRRAPVLISGRAAFARRRSNELFPVELSIGEASHDGQPVYVVVVHDVSERKALEAAYFDAVGHEQRRLGQDLHDGLGQELTGVALLLAALERTAAEAGLPNAADIGRVRDLATHTISTCRSVARGLAPVSEGQGGLVAGLRDLVRRLGELPGPTIQFAFIEAANLGLSPTATDHLYRIAQEAVTNALKHARAHSINIVLDVEPASVRLEICDDGTGIAAPQGSPGDGLGLKSMRYRADVIGARLRVGRRASAGTCVVCECPQSA